MVRIIVAPFWAHTCDVYSQPPTHVYAYMGVVATKEMHTNVFFFFLHHR